MAPGSSPRRSARQTQPELSPESAPHAIPTTNPTLRPPGQDRAVRDRSRMGDDARFTAPALERELVAELRLARRTAGRSQRDVARIARLSQSRVSRVERGVAGDLRVQELGRLASALGLRLWARLYPGGSPVRDHAQVALLQELRRRSHTNWRWSSEVPLPIPGDRRAVDAIAQIAGCRIAVEAWTRLVDLQAQLRAAQLKRRDAGTDRLIVLLADTHANRRTVRAVGEAIRTDLPLGTRQVLLSFAAGRDPGADGLVLLRAGRATRT